MSWRDRDYYRNTTYSDEGPGQSWGLPKPTPYVIYLIVANVAVFIVTDVLRLHAIKDIFDLHGIFSWSSIFDIPKLISYQFLHADTWHLLGNMVGLYFFGSPLERYWGSKRFLFFYFFCGTVAGLTFLLFSYFFATLPIIGASGAVLGLAAACAVLFPSMMVILFILPVPIRFFAILYAAIYALNALTKGDLSDACHLGGMAAGFLYITTGPFWQKFSRQRTQAKRQALMNQEAEDQRVVDQILEKVHQNGIQTLNRREKQTLRDITQRQKLRDELRKKGR